VDAEYETFVGGACIRTPYGAEPDATQPRFPDVCDASGNVVGGTPEWTLFGSAQVQKRMNNGGLFYGQLDVNWKDDMISGTDNDPNKAVDAYALTNLRIGYRFGADRYDIALWAKNLLDEDYRPGGFNSVIREGSLSNYQTEPRTIGLTLRATM